MSSLFKEIQERNTQEPLMDFADVMFSSEKPQTITQAGLDADAEKLRLNFDGTKLRLMAGDKELESWNAVSGKNGYQSPEFQNLKNTGPIPEGNYDVRQDNYSKMGFGSDALGTYYPKVRRNLPNIVKEYLPSKFGSWSGGSRAWGTQKIGLVPTEETDTLGRDNFFIHGGAVPGSAGCVDLTQDNDSFMELFRLIGRDLPLEVIYEKTPRTQQ